MHLTGLSAYQLMRGILLLSALDTPYTCISVARSTGVCIIALARFSVPFSDSRSVEVAPSHLLAYTGGLKRI